MEIMSGLNLLGTTKNGVGGATVVLVLETVVLPVGPWLALGVVSLPGPADGAVGTTN